MKTKAKKSINIDAELWKELQRAKADTGKALHVLMSEAWQSHHPAQPASQGIPTPRPPIRHAEWHTLLDTILDHGTRDDITGIQANLRWGAEAVQKRRPPAKSRAAG